MEVLAVSDGISGRQVLKLLRREKTSGSYMRVHHGPQRQGWKHRLSHALVPKPASSLVKETAVAAAFQSRYAVRDMHRLQGMLIGASWPPIKDMKSSTSRQAVLQEPRLQLAGSSSKARAATESVARLSG